jgi:hypothetical protein
LNYIKAVQKHGEAKGFIGTLIALDDFWLDGRKKTVSLRKPRAIHVGTVIVNESNGYALACIGDEKRKIFDATYSITETIAIGSTME